MKWKKEIYVVEQKGMDENGEKWLEVFRLPSFLPDEECEVGVYQLKEVKKLKIKKTLE